jgi:hypothetical protein
MPAITTIIRLLLLLLSGVGVAQVMDKILPDKVPNYEPVSPGLKPRKLLFFLGAMTAGGLAWNFINRKFHVISRRHAPRRRKSRRGR